MFAEFQYTCVGCGDLEELEYIIDHAREISYRTFAKAIDPDFLEEIKPNGGVPLSRDWAVTFHKSKLPDSRPVYFMDHSAIEHVFY